MFAHPHATSSVGRVASRVRRTFSGALASRLGNDRVQSFYFR